MLYDPKWEKKIETNDNPRSLERFIAWLEKQPAEATYNYCKSQTCLVAQWLQAIGDDDWDLYSREVDELLDGHGIEIVENLPWTFGAALDRARSIASTMGTKS